MDKPLSVFELNSQIKTILEETFLSVYVEGEVSGLTKHTSGHYYFNIKDSQSAIRCVLFRGNAQYLNFDLQNGQKVTIIGGLSVYPPRGDYQILCKQITSNALGDLYQQYEKLKIKLQNKGYFANKKPLPPFPKHIALITSSTGAALQDMLRVASKRWNLTKITILNTLVQGKEAKECIVKNIAYADTLGVDIIVLARGGGSKEDLWAFNEESVADAIHEAHTPIISAIGHESDVLISDFVADLRAPTPSAAMEMILPDQTQWLYQISDLQDTLSYHFSKILTHKTLLIEHLQEQYKLASHEEKLIMMQNQISQLKTLFNLQIKMILEQKENLFFHLNQNYHSYNPIAKFENQITQIREVYNAKNPEIQYKNGYVQITQNCKIAKLEDLKEGDIFELTSPKISKTAKILPKD